MAITISGENNNDRILAADGVIDQLSGFNVVGVITATSFTGDLTGDVTGNLTGNVTGNINNSTLLLQTGGTERLRITGNNEIGIAGGNYGSSGQVFTSGGTNSPVSWTTPAVTAFTNGSNNRVITATSGSGLNGEANLTFDGAELDLNNSGGSARLYLVSGNSADSSIYFGRQNDGATGGIRYEHTNDSLKFMGYNNADKMVIDSSGNVLVGTTDTSVYNNSSGNGIVLRGGQAIDVARSNDLQLTLNRMGNDGPHIAFYKGGGVKSYISTRGNAFCIDVNGTNERLRINSDGRLVVSTNANTTVSFDYATIHFNSDNSTVAEGLFINNIAANTGDNASISFSTDSGNRKKSAISHVDTGNYGRGDLVFSIDPDADSGELDIVAHEKLRITSDGKVLVGDGSSITPSRHLDVRGSGHQQILLGSTNNAGASLMVDGHGGGDGSGGNYGTFEMASDGHLKIRNYDPAKSIIFGTGSNTGSNDSVTIASNGQTTIATAELTVTSSAAYTTHINYNNSGDHYISMANAGATFFRGSNNSITSFIVRGNGNVELPTANYEFTENTFRSKVSESVGNNNPASMTGNMTSMEGSKHSWNNTGGILDLPDYKRSDWQILEVYGEVNPNSGGSGVYSDPFFMLIYQGYGWNGSAVTSYIYAQQFSPMARDVFPSGTGNSGADGMSVVWYDGSNETNNCAYNSTTHYLRIKLDTGSFNTSNGCAASVRIFRRF